MLRMLIFRKALRNLIASRIGVGKYRDCLNQISKNEQFVKATHRKQVWQMILRY